MCEGFLFSYLKALHINNFKNKALHSWHISPTLQRFLCCFLRLFPKPYTTIVIQYITVDLYDFRYYIHPVNRTEG